MSDWIDAVVASAMAEVQRNAVPVINKLLREAATEATPIVCTFEESCESCQ